MDYKLTRAERETVVVFNEAEPNAELYTTSAPVMRRMDKLVAEYASFREVKRDEVSRTYIFPKKYFKVRKPSAFEGKMPANFEANE